MKTETMLAIGVAAGLACPTLGDVASTFDTGDEGWGTLNDATGFTWDANTGNPPGAIRARDIGNGQIWYYSAPAAFLGNQSLAATLSWDIQGIVGNQTSIPDRADVMLLGAGRVIGIDADVQPLNGPWSSWSVAFDASGWESVSSLTSGVLSGTGVTQAELNTVLADLTGMYIRGEYTNGSDATALDNVVLTVIPAPGTVGKRKKIEKNK
jgi:hypothetical protein